MFFPWEAEAVKKFFETVVVFLFGVELFPEGAV